MIFEKIQLEPDEQIVQLVRRHWFYIFKQSFAIFAFIIIPPILFFACISLAYSSLYLLVEQYMAYILFAYAFWLLVSWMLFASIVTNYYLDMWCITNRRVIKIDQIGLFNRETASFRFERLQDISVEVKGIIATLLDFGTLHVETASEDGAEFRSYYMPKPQEIKALILKEADGQMIKADM